MTVIGGGVVSAGVTDNSGGDCKRDARASGASCTFGVAGFGAGCGGDGLCGDDNVVRYCLR